MNEDEEPVQVLVADGHTINADLFKTTVKIDGMEREIEVVVIDPEEFFEIEEGEKNVEPLLGRGFLDEFEVLFKGPKKKIVFYE